MSGKSQRVTLVKAAAVHAAAAVARLADVPEAKQIPPLEEVEIDALNELLLPEPGGTLAYADLSGAVSGGAGIALSAEAASELLLRLIGRDGKPELDPHARSALAEAGNIAASAAAGALGHLAGGVVVPSVPRLAGSMDALLADCAPGTRPTGPALVMRLEIGEEGQTLRLPFFWIPAKS